MTQQASNPWPQTLIGAGVLLTGLALAAGAVTIPSAAGYGGVGPNFLPWVCAVVLTVCGAWIVWEARTGGFRQMEEPSGDAAYWPAFIWVSAGLLANAALITTIGFILANALCFTLAVRGLRASEGKPAGSLRQTLVDAATGLVIAAPVFWLFTRLLAINLPGLTGTGWL